MENKYYYVYLKVNDKYIAYFNGNILREGYSLTDDINDAFYFGAIPPCGVIKDICEQLNIKENDIEIIPDNHYETGLSNPRSIVYKRKHWA